MPWITAQSVNLLLDRAELPVIMSLKHGAVDREADILKGKKESWSQ